MGTWFGLFLDRDNEIWVTGTGNDRHKNGNGKPIYQYKDSCIVRHFRV
jgi:hypothetical protein